MALYLYCVSGAWSAKKHYHKLKIHGSYDGAYKKIKHDNKELIELDRLAKEINSNIAVMSERELQNKIYILQTMIYQFRKTKYLIPDWFECKFYPFLQALEKRTADMRKNRNR